MTDPTEISCAAKRFSRYRVVWRCDGRVVTEQPESSLQVSSTDPTSRAVALVWKAMPVAPASVFAFRLQVWGTVPVSVIVLTGNASAAPAAKRRATAEDAPSKPRENSS